MVYYRGTSTGVGHAHSIIMFKRSKPVENTSGIKSIILPVLENIQIQLYELLWRQEGNTKILQVAVMREDGSMDIDTCAQVSELLSEVLDETDVIKHEYFLEVCSPGAERELRSEEDIAHAVGEYVYIKYCNPKAGKDELYGTLHAVNETSLHLTYMDKVVKKQIDIEKENIALIRLAVKL